jgi:hypothetical protein
MATIVRIAPTTSTVLALRCVACRNRHSTTWCCKVVRGVDLGLFHIGPSREIEVPVCLRCRTLRMAAGFTVGGLFSLTLLLGVFAALPWLDGEGLLKLWIATFIAAIAGLVWFLGNRYSALMDRALLGVCAARLLPDGAAELWVRDEELAAAMPSNTALASYATTTLAGAWMQPQTGSGDSSQPRSGFLERLLEHPFIKPRVRPTLAVISGIGLFALNYWHSLDFWSVFVFPIFAGPVFVLFGLAGLVHPPLLWVLHRNAAPWQKALGIVLLMVGLAIGFWCAVNVFRL